MIASFFAGIVIGVCALMFIASRFVDKGKPQATHDKRIAATSISMDQNAVYSTTLQEQMRIFQLPPKDTA
jgi:hypothetical protein